MAGGVLVNLIKTRVIPVAGVLRELVTNWEERIHVFTAQFRNL